MILTFAVSGYRSLRNLVLPLDRLTLVTGANGSGKSSFYRSIRLLADVAQGRAIASLASEGGLKSTLWAGPEIVTRRMKSGEVPIEGSVRRDRVSLKLGFADEDYGYAIDLGLPVAAGSSLFNADPEIKAERSGPGKLCPDPMRLRAVTARRRGSWTKTATADRSCRTLCPSTA